MSSYNPVVHEREDTPFWLTPIGEPNINQVPDAQSSSPNVSDTSFVSEAALEAYDRMVLEWAESHNDNMARRQVRSEIQQRVERIRQLTEEADQQYAEMMAEHEERMAEIHRSINAMKKKQEWLNKCIWWMIPFGALALLPALMAVEALVRYFS